MSTSHHGLILLLEVYVALQQESSALASASSALVFIQSTNEIFGYRGTGRDESNKAMIGKVGDPIWLDVASLTASFYGTLSVGTFRPDISGTPLLQYNPNIDELSTLVRDTFGGGKGQLSLTPDAAKVTSVAKR